jgi:large subunit ribosomal protein L4
MIKVPVYNSEGKEVETLELDSSIFEGAVNTAVIYQAINGYRANQRAGLASTKTRGEVSGGGKKPWKQKGTGRARVGSTRSPLWRHGGSTFGPHPKDFSYAVPKKIKKVALKSVLLAKVQENNLIVLDQLSFESAKTKDAARMLSKLKLASGSRPSSLLVLLDKADQQLRRPLRNIEALQISLAKDTNAYEVLVAKKLIVTKEGLQTLTHRITQ